MEKERKPKDKLLSSFSKLVQIFIFNAPIPRIMFSTNPSLHGYIVAYIVAAFGMLDVKH